MSHVLLEVLAVRFKVIIISKIPNNNVWVLNDILYEANAGNIRVWMYFVLVWSYHRIISFIKNSTIKPRYFLIISQHFHNLLNRKYQK